jgi:hypothetical protein
MFDIDIAVALDGDVDGADFEIQFLWFYLEN